MIDYSFWDVQEEFTLDQAAYLWIEKEPSLNNIDRCSKWLTINNMLYADIERNHLASRDTSGGVPFLGDTYIKRMDLKNYAEKKGYKPKFLFPEMRIVQDSKPENTAAMKLNESSQLSQNIQKNDVKPSETERNTMLKLIIGMAIDAYGYDPKNSRNSATGDKNGISAKLQAHNINISDDTIRKYLTEAKEIVNPKAQ